MSGLFGAIIAPREDPSVAEAKAALKQLRSSLAEFQNARVYTQRALLGAVPCKYTPAELKARLEFYRDPVMEKRLRSELYDLLKQIYSRDPTPEEMQAGIPDPEGLGLLPALLGVAAIVGGLAWTASSVTAYLTRSEELATGQTRRTEAFGETVTKVVKGAVVVGGLGGAVFGGYKLWKWAKNKPVEKTEALEAPEEEAEEEPDEEEE